MKKILTTFCAFIVAATSFSIPTISMAEQGTHSSEKSGLWDIEHPRPRRWIYRDGERIYAPEYNQDREYRPYQERVYRPHRQYRDYDGGPWIPGAAAILGLGIILGNQPRYAPRPRYQYDHVQYCMNRYRSYRAWDNTYQPNYGPRRVCR